MSLKCTKFDFDWGSAAHHAAWRSLITALPQIPYNWWGGAGCPLPRTPFLPSALRASIVRPPDITIPPPGSRGARINTAANISSAWNCFQLCTSCSDGQVLTLWTKIGKIRTFQGLLQATRTRSNCLALNWKRTWNYKSATGIWAPVFFRRFSRMVGLGFAPSRFHARKCWFCPQ